MTTYDCIIIGAGASGLFFSATLSTPFPPGKGLILEKTSRPGTKLLMSGAGQCNITHSGSIKDFVPFYGKNGGKIRSCLYRHNNLSLCDFLEENGVKTVSRDDGKVFPKSMNAEDILRLLRKKTEENGFSIRYRTSVTSLSCSENGIWKVSCETGEDFYTPKLIVAVGGCSYPSTGSDGKFLTILERDLGLSVVSPRPALTPLNVYAYPYGVLSGIGLKNVHMEVRRGGRKIAENTGDLLFTHHNFSGPLILNLSKEIAPGDEIVFNYLHPTEKAVALKKLTALTEKSKASLPNLTAGAFSLPKSFIQLLCRRSGSSLKALACELTEDQFTVESLCGFNKAMVTAGGVSLSEIHTKTMEAKRFPGLYLIGEVLDIDGATGGYNLQFAYSSARAAGEAIGETRENK